MRANSEVQLTPAYKTWVSELKQKFRQAQAKAAVKVNSTLLQFYWELGADIVERQKNTTWGSGFLKDLSADMMDEFPNVKGFSKRNLERIRGWYIFYSEADEFATQAVSQIRQQNLSQSGMCPFPQLLVIPWSHNLIIVSKCSSIDQALFYVHKTVENGWSRAVLTHQIESGLYNRSGKAITNFSETLPSPQSDLAKQVIKDPYNFDFLTLTEDYNEKELEHGLIEHITHFLLELGAGFAYVGKQIELQVGERDFYIDLLFYHTKLHCYVVIELKTGDFEPEHAGKLNFYLCAVDMQIKQEMDAPTIGILLCKKRDKLVVEYALRDVNSPIGVSEYQLTRSLPEKLRTNLPSIEEIEKELMIEEEN